MIPVRLPADLQVVLASERRFFLDRDHATYEMVCPVCDQTCGNVQGRACVLVFVGINSRNREENPQGRFTVGAGILVHADCAGVPEVAPPKNESNLRLAVPSGDLENDTEVSPDPREAARYQDLVDLGRRLRGEVPQEEPREGITRSGNDVSIALPTVGTVLSSPTLDESQNPTPDPEAVQEPMDREEAARRSRELLDSLEAQTESRKLMDIKGLSVSIDIELPSGGDVPDDVTITKSGDVAADFFARFVDMPHDARMDTHGQWCWKHWAPCPVLGGNGLGASTEIMHIWLEELAVAYVGSPPPYSPEELNDGLEATGKICCVLGDERMYSLWGNWPPTSTLVAGPYAPLAEPTPATPPSAEEHGEPADAPEDPNREG